MGRRLCLAPAVTTTEANGDPRSGRRRPGYGLVLLAIVLAIVIIVFTPDGTAPRFLALIVLAAALLLALRTAEAPPRLQRHAAALVGLALTGAIGSLVA